MRRAFLSIIVMRILFLDPFHGGSHAAVAAGYARHSRHQITLMSLSIAGGWRWRMRGAAVTLARQVRERKPAFDLILTTDMLDLATFLGLTRDLTAHAPVAVYFHENQLTYPLPPGRTRDLSFPWINYTSALSADAVIFNSTFHRNAFLDALPGLIGRYHDHQERDLVERIRTKAHVLPPGIDLARLDQEPGTRNQEPGTKEHEGKRAKEQKNKQDNAPFTPSPLHPFIPTLLWNSRWEYDKQPEAFFAALDALEGRGVDFRVIVAGEAIDPNAAEFVAARERLAPRTVAWGYAPDLVRYRALLWQADIVISTAIQEFFGIALVEAMYCGCLPIAPRRLSYPELIPEEHHATCLYDSQADLVDKLAAAITNSSRLHEHPFHEIAAQYDWRQMAARYDALFEGLRVRG
jgi:glycosyltransferase involved in cell wall biosynthesis